MKGALEREADTDRRGRNSGWPRQRQRGAHRWTPTVRGCRQSGVLEAGLRLESRETGGT